MKAIQKLLQRFKENFSLKIYASFLTAIVVISVVFNLVLFHWQKENLREEIIREGELLSRVLAHNSVLGVFSENEEQIKSTMEAIIQQQNVIGVRVFNHVGELLAYKQRIGASSATDRLSASDIKRQLQSGSMPVAFFEQRESFVFFKPVRFLSYSSEEALYFEDAAAVEEENIGFVQVVMSKERLQKGIRDLLLKNFLVAGLVLFVGGILTYFIVRDMIRPLNRLMEEVQARGIEIEPGDQLSMLSSTFDQLVMQLGNAFETINQLKNDLTLKVNERTRELAFANEKLSQRRIYLEETNSKLEEAMRQLKETQAQMIHSGKMVALGQLVAGVAHEINNTTNFITGALPALGRTLNHLQELLGIYDEIDRRTTKKVMVEKLAEAEALKEDIDYQQLLVTLDMLMGNIREGARRTSQIVKDLNNFSRPGTAEWKAVDIHESIDSTLSLLYSEYKHQIEISKDYQPGLPFVLCSPGQLNQVFMNLLLNAAQAIDKGPGRIQVTTRTRGDRLHITIRDNGKGISEEIRERIFEPFFTTKSVGQGTGLGLSISYGIIKRHQGEILVNSEPGQGTEFEIILPLSGLDNFS